MVSLLWGFHAGVSASLTAANLCHPVGWDQVQLGESPLHCLGKCCPLHHPGPSKKDSVKTRPQFPKLACMVGARHLTPPSPGVGTLFCLLTGPGGMQVGIWQETQSLHKRCRSQGSSWAELSEAGQLREHRARGVPGQDSSSRSPSRMHTSCCHRARFPESWPYPWRRHRLPVELPHGWDTLIHLVPESSPSLAEWLYVMVWGTCDQCSAFKGPVVMLPSWLFPPLQLSWAGSPHSCL